MSTLNPEDPAVTQRLLEVADGLRAHLNREVPAIYVEKETDLLCSAIAKGLDLGHTVRTVMSTFNVDIPLAAPTGADFLAGFATTIKNRIAKPRSWMLPTTHGALVSLFVDPHEWCHVHQDAQGVRAGKWPKPLTHSVLYLAGCLAHTSDGEEYLAKVEGDAYAVSACMRLFFADTPGSIDGYLNSIRTAYNLLGVGLLMAEDVLKSHFATMSAGVLPPIEAAKLSREYLYKHAGDLRGRIAL